jgi:hypothetical protein
MRCELIPGGAHEFVKVDLCLDVICVTSQRSRNPLFEFVAAGGRLGVNCLRRVPGRKSWQMLGIMLWETTTCG